MKELLLDAKAENLYQVFDFLTSELIKAGCENKIILQCKLCVEEIFINIASYAYNPKIGPVHMRLNIIPESNPVKMVLSFADSGVPFNPLDHEDPDINAPLEERPIGGLGIYLVTATMDHVSYEYKDGKNILTMEKILSGTT